MGVAQSVAEGRLIDDHVTDESAPQPVVAVFSLEMPATQLVGRLMCGAANIPMNVVRMGRLQQDDWGKMTKVANNKRGTRIVLYDRSGLTIEGLETEVKRLAAELTKKGQKLALVIVDYLQLMRGTGKEASREQEISSITRRAKGLAKDAEVPMVMLSQLNRAVDSRADKRPTMSDLRESGAIEQDADNIVFIYRPDYYGEGAKVKKNAFQSSNTGATELIVAKQRNGETCTVHVVFVPGQTTFRDLEPGEEDR
jgi:replicative DNA helicase